jgi:hypothetical protein
MIVRSEPDYVDNVPRRLAYEAAHHNAEIIFLSPMWQAILREEDGMTVITRPSLGKLMDKLEAMDKPS